MILKTKDIFPIHKVDGNCILGKNGDISFAFTLTLPEIYSLGEEDFDTINSEMFRFFRMLSNCVIHKQDIFIERPFDGAILPDKTFLQKATKNKFIGRTHLTHHCLLFVSYTQLPALKRTFLNSSILRTGEIFQADRAKIDAFVKEMERAVSVFNASNLMHLTPLTEGDIKEITFQYLNGFQKDKLTDICFKPDFKIGDNYFNVYAVNSTDNLPQSIPTCFKDEQLSSDNFTFFKGYLQPLGLDLECNHIVNQIYYLDGHKELKKELNKVSLDFKKYSKFNPENKRKSTKIDEFVDYVNSDEDIRLCRCHVNLMVWDYDKKSLNVIDNMVITKFKESDITPYQASYIDHIYYYLSCFPGSAGNMPRSETFDTELLTAAKFFIPVTNYMTDGQGLVFTDRKFNIPILKDDFYKPYETKQITARNMAIIAPTGGGKSVLLNSVIRQAIESDFLVAGIDLGNSLETTFHLYPERTAHIQYREGEPLGLNPYLITSMSDLTEYKIQTLADFNFILWKQDQKEMPFERVSMYKIIQAYYKSNPGNLSFPDFHSFVKETRGLLESLEIQEEFFNREEFLHVTSEYATGMFRFLLQDSNQKFNLRDKQAVCFELENIKDNMDILPLVFMMIRDVIDNVIFKNVTFDKRIFMEEAAKLIKYPIMQNIIDYYQQTIRKHYGSLIYVLQTLDQVPENVFGNALITNTQIFHILKQDGGEENLRRRLKLSDHEMYQIYSIQNDFTSEIKYTEDFVRLGSKGNVLRLEVPREAIEAFRSEQKDKEPLYKEYRKNGNMEQSIINILKQNR
jgi:conjugation system TraG family ATPase